MKKVQKKKTAKNARRNFKKYIITLVVIAVAIIFLQQEVFRASISKLQPTKETNPVVEKNTITPYLQEQVFVADYKGDTVFYESGKNEIYIPRTKTGGVRVDLKDLTNQFLAYTTSSLRIDSFGGFVDESKHVAYLTVAVRSPDATYASSGELNEIYKVDLGTQKSKKIWSNYLNERSRYGKESRGTAGVSKVYSDDYVLLSVAGCYACESTTTGEIILNAKTGAEKFLQTAGEVIVNLPNKTFTYARTGGKDASTDTLP